MTCIVLAVRKANFQVGDLIKHSKKNNSKSSEEKDLTGSVVLRHVAIIMDGNRRWADRKHLPRVWGHKEGVQSLKKLVKHASRRKISYMTVYAFSSENWQRGREEVDYLFDLFSQVLTDELAELHEANVRLRFIGKLDGMPKNLEDGFRRAMDLTANNKGLNLQVALNYGSRLEIAEACKEIAEEVISGKLKVEEINPDLISKHLYTNEIPDPDLVIRTGGEMRLSNYLLWQSAYAEIYVTDVMWPEFDEEKFDLAIKEFNNRQRRYGGD